MFKILLLILFLGVPSNHNNFDKFDINQNDYKINFEHADVNSYNKNYLKELKLRTFKYNRTCTAFNLNATINSIDMGNNVELVLQAYRFASNEYRLFPLRFQFNLCDGLAKNTFGLKRATQCGNFSRCPFEKEKSYNVCNFTPDQSQFPPLIPNGRYMMEFQALYISNEVAVVRFYIEITRPIVKK